MKISKRGTVFLFSLMISAFLVSCITDSVTQTQSTRKESKGELRKVKSVYIDLFVCECQKSIPLSIQDSIIEIFLPNNLSIATNRNEAEAVIEGAIVITHDSKSDMGAFGDIATGSYASGKYVSAVTARVTNNKGKVLAIASATQVRNVDWVPDPPPIIGRWVGEKLLFALTGKKIKSRRSGSGRDYSERPLSAHEVSKGRGVGDIQNLY